MQALVQEFFSYLKGRMKWWLLPALFVLVGFGGLLILARGSAIGPLIYTIF